MSKSKEVKAPFEIAHLEFFIFYFSFFSSASIGRWALATVND